MATNKNVEIKGTMRVQPKRASKATLSQSVLIKDWADIHNAFDLFSARDIIRFGNDADLHKIADLYFREKKDKIGQRVADYLYRTVLLLLVRAVWLVKLSGKADVSEFSIPERNQDFFWEIPHRMRKQYEEMYADHDEECSGWFLGPEPDLLIAEHVMVSEALNAVWKAWCDRYSCPFLEREIKVIRYSPQRYLSKTEFGGENIHKHDNTDPVVEEYVEGELMEREAAAYGRDEIFHRDLEEEKIRSTLPPKKIRERLKAENAEAGAQEAAAAFGEWVRTASGKIAAFKNDLKRRSAPVQLEVPKDSHSVGGLLDQKVESTTEVPSQEQTVLKSLAQPMKPQEKPESSIGEKPMLPAEQSSVVCSSPPSPIAVSVPAPKPIVASPENSVVVKVHTVDQPSLNSGEQQTSSSTTEISKESVEPSRSGLQQKSDEKSSAVKQQTTGSSWKEKLAMQKQRLEDLRRQQMEQKGEKRRQSEAILRQSRLQSPLQNQSRKGKEKEKAEEKGEADQSRLSGESHSKSHKDNFLEVEDEEPEAIATGRQRKMPIPLLRVDIATTDGIRDAIKDMGKLDRNTAYLYLDKPAQCCYRLRRHDGPWYCSVYQTDLDFINRSENLNHWIFRSAFNHQRVVISTVREDGRNILELENKYGNPMSDIPDMGDGTVVHQVLEDLGPAIGHPQPTAQVRVMSQPLDAMPIMAEPSIWGKIGRKFREAKAAYTALSPEVRRKERQQNVGLAASVASIWTAVFTTCWFSGGLLTATAILTSLSLCVPGFALCAGGIGILFVEKKSWEKYWAYSHNCWKFTYNILRAPCRPVGWIVCSSWYKATRYAKGLRIFLWMTRNSGMLIAFAVAVGSTFTGLGLWYLHRSRTQTMKKEGFQKEKENKVKKVLKSISSCGLVPKFIFEGLHLVKFAADDKVCEFALTGFNTWFRPEQVYEGAGRKLWLYSYNLRPGQGWRKELVDVDHLEVRELWNKYKIRCGFINDDHTGVTKPRYIKTKDSFTVGFHGKQIDILVYRGELHGAWPSAIHIGAGRDRTIEEICLRRQGSSDSDSEEGESEGTARSDDDDIEYQFAPVPEGKISSFYKDKSKKISSEMKTYWRRLKVWCNDHPEVYFVIPIVVVVALVAFWWAARTVLRSKGAKKFRHEGFETYDKDNSIPIRKMTVLLPNASGEMEPATFQWRGWSAARDELRKYFPGKQRIPIMLVDANGNVRNDEVKIRLIHEGTGQTVIQKQIEKSKEMAQQNMRYEGVIKTSKDVSWIQPIRDTETGVHLGKTHRAGESLIFNKHILEDIHKHCKYNRKIKIGRDSASALVDISPWFKGDDFNEEYVSKLGADLVAVVMPKNLSFIKPVRHKPLPDRSVQTMWFLGTRISDDGLSETPYTTQIKVRRNGKWLEYHAPHEYKLCGSGIAYDQLGTCLAGLHSEGSIVNDFCRAGAFVEAHDEAPGVFALQPAASGLATVSSTRT